MIKYIYTNTLTVKQIYGEFSGGDHQFKWAKENYTVQIILQL